MKLEIGNRITWNSAAGVQIGTITNIVLAPNAAGDTVAWMDVKTTRTTVRLCAIDMNLAQLRVELYQDNMVERTNLMTGKKYMESQDTPIFCSPASESYWSM